MRSQGLRLGVLVVALCVHEILPAGQPPDLELGEYLSTECTTCHRPDAVNAGIPNIFGLPSVVFIQAMEQYRDGTRFNQVMNNVVHSLSAQEIAALAAYMEQARPKN